jgi:hypothetical protein
MLNRKKKMGKKMEKNKFRMTIQIVIQLIQLKNIRKIKREKKKRKKHKTKKLTGNIKKKK